MSDPSGTGVLSSLAPIMQGATIANSDPGWLRRGLAGRGIARRYLAGELAVDEMWAVAEHLGLSRRDVYRGAQWTQADLTRVRDRLGITQKTSVPSGRVTA